MKIPGYTLYGDYYLSDDVITNVNWKEACEMKEIVTLPNDKKVIAHTLSKEELETIPQEERAIGNRWYWTSTPNVPGSNSFMNFVSFDGDFLNSYRSLSHIDGGARLGFHKKEIKQFLDVE